jgi:hypothetical protein
MSEKQLLSTVNAMLKGTVLDDFSGDASCFNVNIPLQGAFWVSSPFSIDGVSASSLVGVENGYLHVYAPIKMSSLSKPGKFIVVIGLPLHAGESKSEDNHHLVMALEVEFDAFLFNETKARFAKLKVLNIEAGQQEYMRKEVKPVLDARDSVYGEFKLNSALGSH